MLASWSVTDGSQAPFIPLKQVSLSIFQASVILLDPPAGRPQVCLLCFGTSLVPGGTGYSLPSSGSPLTLSTLLCAPGAGCPRDCQGAPWEARWRSQVSGGASGVCVFPQLPPCSCWSCPGSSTKAAAPAGLPSAMVTPARVLAPASSPCHPDMGCWYHAIPLGLPQMHPFSNSP